MGGRRGRGARRHDRDPARGRVLRSRWASPRSSKRLGLRSESSARFERGVDPERRARRVGRVRRSCSPRWPARTSCPSRSTTTRCRSRRRGSRCACRGSRRCSASTLGADAGARTRCARSSIEIEEPGAGGGDEFVAIPPTFRPDLEREIDIVEEVGAPRRLQRDPAHAAAHDRAGRRRAHRAPARTAPDRRRDGRHRACREAMTVPLIAERGPRRGSGCRPTAPSRRRTRCAPTSRSCGPRSCPACSSRSRATRARASPTSRCSSSATSSPRRSPATLLPDERDHLAVAAHRHRRRRAPIEPDRPVDVVRRGRRRSTRWSRRSSSPTSRLVAGPEPGFDPARSAAITVDGATIGHVGRARPARCSTRFGIPVPAVAFELDIDGLLAGHAARPGLPARCRASRRRASTSRSCCADSVPAADVEQTLRDAAGDAARGGARVRRVPQRRARRRAAEPRVRAALPAPDRTLTDKEIGALRQAVHRRGRHGARRRAPGLSA